MGINLFQPHNNIRLGLFEDGLVTGSDHQSSTPFPKLGYCFGGAFCDGVLTDLLGLCIQEIDVGIP